MATTTRLHTAEDLWRMPSDEPWELWEGELRKVPGAGGVASELAGVIFALIWPFVRSRKLGMLTTADGTYILARNPDTIVVPDVGFVSWDRLPGRARPDKYIPTAPDLAIEVLSPNDGPRDIANKMERYDRGGVPLVWWVHPKQRTVAVYRNGRLVTELREADELDGENILPGFRLTVSDIFSMP